MNFFIYSIYFSYDAFTHDNSDLSIEYNITEFLESILLEVSIHPQEGSTNNRLMVNGTQHSLSGPLAKQSFNEARLSTDLNTSKDITDDG